MLYIMRHGRTDWNVRHKLQGRTDIPLNEEGRRMAEKAGEEYRNIPLDLCFCSPLVRARETAEIVLRGRNIPIRTDDRLREMSFGIYEGTENSFSDPDCPVNVISGNRKPIRSLWAERKPSASCSRGPGSSCGKWRIPCWNRERIS